MTDRDHNDPGRMVEWEAVTVVKPDGENVVYVLPQIPDGAPKRIREGISRRRLTAITGVCPCGAQMIIPTRDQRVRMALRGQTINLSVAHEDTCPAVDQTLADEIRSWIAPR